VSYTSRRERERKIHEAEIIAAAEKVFYQKGFNEVSMDEIAETAEFTKKTLYQYFSNKKELYFAVACKGYQTLFERLQLVDQTENNGFGTMRLLVFTYYHFYLDFPHTFRLLKSCSLIGSIDEKSFYYQRFEHLKTVMIQIFIDTVEKGKKDTSIRQDVDSRMAAYSIVYFIIGFFYRLSEVGHAFKTDKTLNQEDFIRFSLELLSNTLAQNK
jgi:TetR/AcrR family transcriptional regulator